MDQPIEEYSAAGLGRVAHSIRELQVPERPRFVKDLLCIPSEGSVYLFGGETQLLQGGSVDWLLTTMAPKLDGTRTLTELRQCFPELSDEAFSDVLHLLLLHGMLEAGPEPSFHAAQEVLEAEYGRQMTFFSRYLRVTGSCRNRYEAQQRLLASVVALVGQAGACRTLAEQLKAHGVTTVTPQSIREIATGSAPRVVVCTGDFDAQVEAARLCLVRDLSLLCLDLENLTLGPLMVPRVTACPTCVALQRGPSSSGVSPLTPVRELWGHALLSRATQRVLSYLTLMYQVESLGEVETWQPERGQAARHRDVLRLPNCSTCGAPIHPLSVTLPTGHQDNMAVLFHQASAIMPWQLGQPALMQQHLNANVLRTVRTAFREHPEAERIAIPETQELNEATVTSAFREIPTEPVVCDLTRLGTALRFSAGGRILPLAGGGYHILRYTASGGNLGSAELYLFVRSVVGLAQGIYHYLLVGDMLERLGDVADADIARLTWSDSADTSYGDADAIVVIVSDVAREFSKYSDRGYVYCLLDAGLVAHRLALLAGQLGLTAQICTSFDDQEVQRLLKLSFPQSAPACIVALRGRG